MMLGGKKKRGRFFLSEGLTLTFQHISSFQLVLIEEEKKKRIACTKDT